MTAVPPAAPRPDAQPAGWDEQRRRWTAFYADRLSAQLERAAALAADAPAGQLRPHFDSFLALLNAAGGRPELAPLWLRLVDRLHPRPLRWGQWSAWLAILRQAARKAHDLDRPEQQAEYLAYAAELLFNVGQSEPALAMAREAMQLARQWGAAWPLCVAGNVATATLRSMAQYDEAQATLDAAQADASPMARPHPAARAAMAEALLDLERMDLLRYFKRLDEALALGERLIDRLSAVEGIDPHDQAHAHLRRATITWVSGRYAEAEADLKRSAALYRQAGDALQATFAEANLGVVYYSTSRYQEAETLKLAALRAAEEINARHTMVSEMGDLSVIYIAKGDMHAALDFSDRMVALATELGNAAELSRGRGNRGYALLGLGRYDDALEDIEFSLDLYRSQGRVEGLIVTTIDKIMYLRGIGEEERAARLAEENYEAALAEEFPHLHVATARCLAQFPPEERQRALLQRALALAREHGRPLDEAGCLFSLAAITPDRRERVQLYDRAAAMLHRMGCPGWLDGRSVDDPPQLPTII